MDYAPSKANYYKHISRGETGSLGKLFIRKIIDARPDGVEQGVWVELIFGLHERFIVQYVAMAPFEIPGYFKPVPDVRIPGLKNGRLVATNRRVWVRFDLKYPDVIEIEAAIGPRQEPKIFQMNRQEWNDVKRSLSPISRRDLGYISNQAP